MSNLTVGSDEYKRTVNRWGELHRQHVRLNALTPSQQREMERLNAALHEAELIAQLRQAGAHK